VGGVTYDGSRTHMRQELRELKKKKKNRLRGMFVISLSLSLSHVYIYKQARKVGGANSQKKTAESLCSLDSLQK
jgi:hypothetical protein